MASAWQDMMIALACSSSLTRVLQNNRRISSTANQFVGGPDEDSALRTALVLRQRGIRASLFFLGEYITDPAIAGLTVDSLARVLAALNRHGLDTHVSMDPTQIGFSIRDELGEENALRVAASFPAQRSAHSFLMVDMEDVCTSTAPSGCEAFWRTEVFRPPSRCRPTCGEPKRTSRAFCGSGSRACGS